jgi:hypothetical protein
VERDGQLSRIDTRREPHFDLRVAGATEGLDDKGWPEVPTADAEVHDRFDWRAAGKERGTVADRCGQLGHPVPVGHHICRRLVPGKSLEAVGGRPSFGRVDDIALGDPAEEAGHVPIAGQGNQGLEDPFVHVLAGRVDPQVAGLDGQASGSVRIGGEKLAEGRESSVAPSRQGTPGLGRFHGHGFGQGRVE